MSLTINISLCQKPYSRNSFRLIRLRKRAQSNDLILSFCFPMKTGNFFDTQKLLKKSNKKHIDPSLDNLKTKNVEKKRKKIEISESNGSEQEN